MPADADLIEKARRVPHDLRFEEATKLAEQLGFKEVRQIGSHRIYHHPDGRLLRDAFPQPLNLQCGGNGKAKGYQVEQMLAMADQLDALKKKSGAGGKK